MTASALRSAIPLALSLLAGFAVAGPVTVDPKLPEYATATGVSGTIKSVGSDTINNLMTLWAEAFHKRYPNIAPEIEGKGSGSAPTALIEGTANFGPMSREMKGSELDEFERAFGYKPTGLRTSIDMLAIYVHKDNPIQSLTLQQVDAIFSKNRKGGAAREIATWGDLGLTGAWKERPVTLYGRNSTSGTYAYFKEHALFKGDFKDTVKEQPGSSSVVSSIAADLSGIGYSGIGYLTPDVRAVALSDGKGPAIPVEPENAYSGKYPLGRFLYVYVNHKPGTQLDTLRREFIRLIFSRQGQEGVLKDGYLPVPFAIARAELAKVGISLDP